MEGLARVRMLGNYLGYENGHEYDVPMADALRMCGMGVSVMVDVDDEGEEE